MAEEKDKLNKTGETTASALAQGERKNWLQGKRNTQVKQVDQVIRHKQLQHKWTVTVREDMQ